jgi:uncharacterized CHY-type Zn-finger protein
MDGVLKGLQGKSLTKKKIFDFLADINLEELCGKKENVLHVVQPVESIQPSPKEIASISLPDLQPEPEPKLESQPKQEPQLKIPNDFKIELIPISPEKEEHKEIKCQACQKTFTVNGSLKRHLERSTVCANWIESPQKSDVVPLTRGIHLIIDELLDKAISGADLECKFCKAKFINKGNHHKHFNYATVCNRLAYQEFKKIFLSL